MRQPSGDLTHWMQHIHSLQYHFRCLLASCLPEAIFAAKPQFSRRALLTLLREEHSSAGLPCGSALWRMPPAVMLVSRSLCVW